MGEREGLYGEGEGGKKQETFWHCIDFSKIAEVEFEDPNPSLLWNTPRDREKMKAPVRVSVTGAAGQICYSLLFRLCHG